MSNHSKSKHVQFGGRAPYGQDLAIVGFSIILFPNIQLGHPTIVYWHDLFPENKLYTGVIGIDLYGRL